MEKLKVMIVEDSAFMRQALKKILDSSRTIEVVAIARNGVDALEKLEEIKPDVITLDIEMPVMNGLDTLKAIMNNYEIPVVMISSATKEGAEITLKCLELGAVDFITKPSGEISLDIEKIKYQIINKIIVAGSSKVTKKSEVKKEEKKYIEILFRERITNKYIQAIGIGISTGGPKTLFDVIPYLPKNLPCPVFLVQHMPAGFTKSFAERLNSSSQIEVKEAENGERIEPGIVYLAPGDWHMTIKQKFLGAKKYINLSKSPTTTLHRPSVDVMLYSMADIYKGNTIAVIMTGMGRDGAEGVKKIKKYNGIVIAENESTAVIYGMPAAVVDDNNADFVLPSTKIAEKLVSIIQSK